MIVAGETIQHKGLKTWIYFIILAFFTASLSLFGLGNSHLKGSGENRVAGIAVEMEFSGDLVVPRLNNEPFLEKPPMYFWIASACFNLFGINDFTARLPSATAAILCVFLVFFIIRITGFSDFTAFISAIILATATGFWSLGHLCGTDMMLCLFITSAMVCFYQYSRYLPKITLWYIGFILSLSCALLTKGLVGIAIPLSAIFFWLLLQPNFFLKNWILFLIGSVLCLIPISIWIYYLHDTLGWNAVYEVVWSNNFGRFTSAYGGHQEPFYYYILNFPANFTPWIIFLPFAIVYHLKETKAWKEKSAPIFFLLWLIAPFILLSISSGKRGIYLLSLYPAAALLVGSAVGSMVESHNSPRKIFTIPSLMLGLIVVLVSAGFCIISIYFKLPLITSLIISLSGLCLSILACKRFFEKEFTVFFKTIATALFVIFLTYSNGISPLFNKDGSYQSVFNYFENLSTNGSLVNLYRPSERIRGAAVFYLRRNVHVIKAEENLKAFLSSNEKNVALIVIGKNDVQKLQSTKILKSFIVGRRKIIFLANENVNI